MDQGLERRVYERRQGVAPVLYANYSTERYSDASLSDYCIGGMAFVAGTALQPGADLCVKMEGRLRISYARKLTDGLRAEVIWCRELEDSLAGQYKVGVEYYEPVLKYQDRPWQRSYDGRVPNNISYGTIVAPDFLSHSARRFPERPAVICNNITLTYADLDKTVGRLATCLTAFGIQKGDHVAIALPNIIPAVAGYFAVLKIGAVVVPCDMESSDRKLATLVRDTDVKVMITLDRWRHRMIAIRRETGIRQLIFVSEKDYSTVGRRIGYLLSGKHLPRMRWKKPEENTYMWNRVMNDYSANPPNTRLSFHDPAICYPHGDTQGSKECIQRISHGDLSRQVQQLAAWFPNSIGESERILGAALFHDLFGLTWAVLLPIYQGWQTVSIPNVRDAMLPALIRQLNPTIVPLVSDCYARLADMHEFSGLAAKSVKIFVAGKTPLPVATAKACAVKTGMKVIEAYNPGYCFPVTHLQPATVGGDKIGSIGIPLPDIDCRVVEIGSGEIDVPVGKPGELIYRGPWGISGEDREIGPRSTSMTGKSIWRRSGEIVRMDEDGFFYRLSS